MPAWDAWATVTVISLLAVISPGPDFAVTVHVSARHGIRAGLLAVAGIVAGLVAHVTYSVLGLAVVVAQSAATFGVVKWIGAAYLVFIGIQALRAGRSVDDGGSTGVPAPPASPTRTGRWLAHLRHPFLLGLLTNLLNVKATLFFLAVFSQVVGPGDGIGPKLVYGLTVMVLAAAWFALVATAIGQPVLRRRYRRIGHWIDRLTGGALVLLGARLAATEAGP